MHNKLLFSCVVLLMVILAFVFLPLRHDSSASQAQSYTIRMSKENYAPVIFPFSSGRIEMRTKDGAVVDKGDKCVSLTLHYKDQIQDVFVAADLQGQIFYTFTDSGVFNYGEALAYIIAPSETGEIFFWVQDEKNPNIQLGMKVTLSANNQSINGVVSIIFGDYIKNRGQKIGIRLRKDLNIAFLIPHSKMMELR